MWLPPIHSGITKGTEGESPRAQQARGAKQPYQGLADTKMMFVIFVFPSFCKNRIDVHVAALQ